MQFYFVFCLLVDDEEQSLLSAPKKMKTESEEASERVEILKRSVGQFNAMDGSAKKFILSYEEGLQKLFEKPSEELLKKNFLSSLHYLLGDVERRWLLKDQERFDAMSVKAFQDEFIKHFNTQFNDCLSSALFEKYNENKTTLFDFVKRKLELNKQVMPAMDEKSRLKIIYCALKEEDRDKFIEWLTKSSDFLQVAKSIDEKKGIFHDEQNKYVTSSQLNLLKLEIVNSQTETKNLLTLICKQLNVNQANANAAGNNAGNNADNN